MPIKYGCALHSRSVFEEQVEHKAHEGKDDPNAAQYSVDTEQRQTDEDQPLISRNTSCMYECMVKVVTAYN